MNNNSAYGYKHIVNMLFQNIIQLQHKNKQQKLLPSQQFMIIVMSKNIFMLNGHGKTKLRKIFRMVLILQTL